MLTTLVLATSFSLAGEVVDSVTVNGTTVRTGQTVELGPPTRVESYQYLMKGSKPVASVLFMSPTDL